MTSAVFSLSTCLRPSHHFFYLIRSIEAVCAGVGREFDREERRSFRVLHHGNLLDGHRKYSTALCSTFISCTCSDHISTVKYSTVQYILHAESCHMCSTVLIYSAHFRMMQRTLFQCDALCLNPSHMEWFSVVSYIMVYYDIV